MKASGEFDVKIQPLDSYSKGNDGIIFGRMSIDKIFSGEMSIRIENGQHFYDFDYQLP